MHNNSLGKDGDDNTIMTPQTHRQDYSGEHREGVDRVKDCLSSSSPKIELCKNCGHPIMLWSDTFVGQSFQQTMGRKMNGWGHAPNKSPVVIDQCLIEFCLCDNPEPRGNL